MSGKGSKRRPTDETAYEDAYDRIFGNGVQAVHGSPTQDGEGNGHGQVQPDAGQGATTEHRG